MDKFISCTTQQDGSVDIYIPPSMVEEFKQVIFKGTNCSPNQSHDIRDFHDRLRNQQHIMNGNMVENKTPQLQRKQVKIFTKPAEQIKKIINTTKDSFNDIDSLNFN